MSYLAGAMPLRKTPSACVSKGREVVEEACVEVVEVARLLKG